MLVRFDVLRGITICAAGLWTLVVGVAYFWQLKQIESYRSGDVAGAINPPVASSDYQESRARHEKYEAVRSTIIWLIGLGAIGFGGRLLRIQQAEREQARAELQRSETRLRALFEDSPIPIWLEDFSEVLKCIDGWRASGIVNLCEYLASRPEEVHALAARVQVIEVNQVSVKAFGAKDKSEVFREMPNFFTADSLAVFREEVCALVEGKNTFAGEVPLLNVQGTPVVFEVTLSVQPGHEKTLDRVIISFVDITQRRRIEETLRHERDRAQLCLDTVESIILGVSPEGIILSINRKGCSLLERSEAELVGKNWFELCLPAGSERQVHWEQFSKHIGELDPRFERVENTVVTKSGALRRIAWHNSLLKDAAGNVLGTLSAGDDVTEWRNLEGRLLDAQKMEAIGQLAGGVAHDFNNILSATMLNIDLLSHQPHLTEDMRDMLSELQKETQRAAEITRQLLMFSRRSVFEYKVIDINALTSRVVDMLGRLLGERISIEFERRTAVAFVEADEDMITQVLMNICINARDAMPRGGRISIVTDVTEVDSARARMNPDRHPGMFLRISLSDTGAGMDEAVVSRIFEPFFTTKEFGKGSGLGLAAVYGIVAQHGGWVEVESHIGKGTTFRVLLPMLVPRPGKTKELVTPKN